MISTLSGKNNYLLHRRLAEITAKFTKKYGDLAVEKIEAEEIESQKLVEAVQALPFLVERRLVIIRDLSQNAPASENIEQIISSIPDAVDVVFYEPSIDRRSRLFKELIAKTEFEEFAEVDSRALPSWLVGEAKKQGGELSLSGANYLVERLGPDQMLLASELDKLITYDPKISPQNIDLLTDPTPQSRIFDLLDAAFKQDKQRALKLYDEQRAQKVEPQAILAMLAWQLRLLTISKYKGNRSLGEVSRDFGISEYPLRKAGELAGRFDEPKLKQMVHEALEIDLKAKTSAVDLDEALKTYIATL